MSVTALPNQADSEAIVASFRALPCADVADGLLRLGLVGIVQGIAPLDPRWTVCGRAVTVRHVPLQDRSLWSGDATNLAKLLPLCQPEDIVVVDVGGRMDVGIFGSIAAREAKEFGLGGFIIDGACRDTQEIVDADCPTFVRGACLNYPTYLRPCCLNSEPIQIGVPPNAASVNPGDIIMGDKDGIVVVPADRAAAVLDAARQSH